jgi:hypothetical protein
MVEKQRHIEQGGEVFGEGWEDIGFVADQDDDGELHVSIRKFNDVRAAQGKGKAKAKARQGKIGGVSCDARSSRGVTPQTPTKFAASIRDRRSSTALNDRRGPCQTPA